MALAFVFSTVSPSIAYAVDPPKNDDPDFFAGNDILTYSREAVTCSTANTPASSTPAPTATTVTVEQKIAQTFIVGYAPTQTEEVRQAVKDYKIGGVFFNGEDFSKLNKAYFDELNTTNGTPLFISADDEGGKVTRFVPDMPSAQEMGATMSTADIEAQGKKVAEALKANGANVDLAPVLDIQNPNGFMTKSNRTWSTNPDVISEKAGAFAKGLNSGGVRPVYKHFPGIGDLTQNTDHGQSASQSLKHLEDTGQLKPYQTIANQNNGAVMLSNGLIDEWGNTPVSLNPQTVNYLRGTVKFTGLITTDDLSPVASYSGMNIPDAVAAALNAGVDMPLFTNTNISDVITTVKAKVSEDKIEKAYQNAMKFRGKDTTGTAIMGCCPTSAAGSIALSGDTNEEKILSFFMNHGLTLAQAAGFVGNMFQESGLNPAAVQPSTTTDDPDFMPRSGQGFGLVQWTFPERQVPLREFIKSKNLSMIDMGGQLGFVWQELTSDTWKPMMEALNAYKDDPVESAITIHGRKNDNIRGYEESNDSAEKVRTVRGGKAKEVYDKYVDKATLTTGVSTSAGTPDPGTCTGATGNAVAAGDFVFYRQADPKWGGEGYAGGTYAGNACGATSPAMVIATWKDKSVIPTTTGSWIQSNSVPYDANQMPTILDHWGVKGDKIFAYTGAPGNSKERIDAALRAGNFVIVSGAGARPFTSVGHFVVLRGITADGQYLIGDPNSPSSGTEEYNQKPWDPNVIYGASEFRSATIAIKP